MGPPAVSQAGFRAPLRLGSGILFPHGMKWSILAGFSDFLMKLCHAKTRFSTSKNAKDTERVSCKYRRNSGHSEHTEMRPVYSRRYSVFKEQ